MKEIPPLRAVSPLFPTREWLDRSLSCTLRSQQGGLSHGQQGKAFECVITFIKQVQPVPQARDVETRLQARHIETRIVQTRIVDSAQDRFPFEPNQVRVARLTGGQGGPSVRRQRGRQAEVLQVDRVAR